MTFGASFDESTRLSLLQWIQDNKSSWWLTQSDKYLLELLKAQLTAIRLSHQSYVERNEICFILIWFSPPPNYFKERMTGFDTWIKDFWNLLELEQKYIYPVKTLVQNTPNMETRTPILQAYAKITQDAKTHALLIKLLTSKRITNDILLELGKGGRYHYHFMVDCLSDANKKSQNKLLPHLPKIIETLKKYTENELERLYPAVTFALEKSLMGFEAVPFFDFVTKTVKSGSSSTSMEVHANPLALCQILLELRAASVPSVILYDADTLANLKDYKGDYSTLVLALQHLNAKENAILTRKILNLLLTPINQTSATTAQVATSTSASPKYIHPLAMAKILAFLNPINKMEKWLQGNELDFLSSHSSLENLAAGYQALFDADLFAANFSFLANQDCLFPHLVAKAFVQVWKANIPFVVENRDYRESIAKAKDPKLTEGIETLSAKNILAIQTLDCIVNHATPDVAANILVTLFEAGFQKLYDEDIITFVSNFSYLEKQDGSLRNLSVNAFVQIWKAQIPFTVDKKDYRQCIAEAKDPKLTKGIDILSAKNILSIPTLNCVVDHAAPEVAADVLGMLFGVGILSPSINDTLEWNMSNISAISKLDNEQIREFASQCSRQLQRPDFQKWFINKITVILDPDVEVLDAGSISLDSPRSSQGTPSSSSSSSSANSTPRGSLKTIAFQQPPPPPPYTALDAPPLHGAPEPSAPAAHLVFGSST